MSMEQIGSYEQPKNEFEIALDDERDFRETSPNPEAYEGCLVQAMHAANSGNGAAREAIASTVVDSRGRDFAMHCGRCGITMIRDDGVVYGARRCALVKSGQESLGELA